MAIAKLDIDSFLEMAELHLVLDVRSPSEYAHAHIPGANSLPLFSDEERKVVGTAYKQVSREEAIKIGLDYFGPKLRQIVEQVGQLLADKKTDTILIYCWRGGMRSAGVAWLLDLYGFKVFTLKGGYKNFRTWVLSQFEIPYNFKVIGGNTGSGKTEILHELKSLCENVIDLEELAGHKGSTFGNLGLPAQPSAELFENKLAMNLSHIGKIGKADSSVWIEAESQRIGQINIQPAFFLQLKNAQTFFIEIPFEERLKFIVKHYGKFGKEELMSGIYRIRKRLGGLDTKLSINYLLEDNVEESFRILLSYYDRLYKNSTQQNRFKIEKLEFLTVNPEFNALQILNQTQEK